MTKTHISVAKISTTMFEMVCICCVVHRLVSFFLHLKLVFVLLIFFIGLGMLGFD